MKDILGATMQVGLQLQRCSAVAPRTAVCCQERSV